MKDKTKLKFKKPTSFRLTKACNKKIYELMGLYPDDYKTKSDVVRAGVFALSRWRAGK